MFLSLVIISIIVFGLALWFSSPYLLWTSVINLLLALFYVYSHRIGFSSRIPESLGVILFLMTINQVLFATGLNGLRLMKFSLTPGVETIGFALWAVICSVILVALLMSRG